MSNEIPNRVNLSFSVSIENIASEIEELFARIPVADAYDLHSEILNRASFQDTESRDEIPTLVKSLIKFTKLVEEVAIRSSEVCQMLIQYEQSAEQIKNPQSHMTPPDMQPLVEAAEEVKNIQE